MKQIILYFLFFLPLAVEAQNDKQLRSLPEINVQQVQDDAFEKGKISVKLHHLQAGRLELNDVRNLQHPALQQLSRQYRFTAIQPAFANVLKDELKIIQHQRWGLDLWFAIEFDKTLSVKQLYQDLKLTNLFEVVEPVYKKHLLDGVNFIPNDPSLAEQWNYDNTGQHGAKPNKDIKLLNAWDIETGNPNVIVSVHDMGVQLDHPDLVQNLLPANKHFNFVDNNATITPGYHGTHVAGTIAATNNNGIGVSGIAGGNGNVNSGARIMSMEIFDLHKSGNIAESYVFAADNGAAISSNSWAYDFENIYELSVMDAIDYFIANGGGGVLQGGLVIFAAGNISKSLNYFPPAYDRVVSVAATDYNDRKTVYSTYGKWVDITAPGGDYSNPPYSQILSTTVNSSYASDHGTSMACPHVSGVAALIVSKLLGKASASDVRDILLSTTDGIDSLNANFIGKLGSGRLNAYKALLLSQAIANNITTDTVNKFTVAANCTVFQLNWQKNTTNNDVLIAYSNQNNIGIPLNNKTYNAGDMIGGGQVIYKGNANSFTLLKNDSLLHFFKIWSVNNNQYSLGKTAELVMPGVLKVSGTFQQNFDFPPYFPTQEWRCVNPDNDLTWIHTVADTANTGAGDLYSVCMYNYEYNTTLGAVDMLTSPLVQVQNTDSVKMSFWYAYRYRNTGLGVNDSLEILLSTDCGNTYTSLWKKGGTDLATVSSTPDSAFYPFGIEKWKQISLDLTPYNMGKQISLAFKATNGKGNNLFIDNIIIDARFKNDAGIAKLNEKALSGCNKNISPAIQLVNKGNAILTSAKIAYTIDGANEITTNWNGSLKSDDSVTVALNSIVTTAGTHTIKIYSSMPNGFTDYFTLNDTLVASFYVSQNSLLPMNEGFEATIFPTHWSVDQQPIDVITWAKAPVGHNSSGSFLMNNYMNNYSGTTDDLITPVFEIDRNMDSSFVLFDYAYNTKSKIVMGDDYDTLELAITKDCGASWQTIWKKGGGDLLTSSRFLPYAEFIPAQSEWKKDSILIAGSLNKGDKVQLRFRNIGYWGNDLYIDNVQLYTRYYAPGVKDKGYAVYPNPAKNYLIIQHVNPPVNLKAIKIINTVGKRVSAFSYNGNADKEILLNVSNLATGVYVLQMIYDDKTVTEKMIKQN